jgi:restriction system protein
MPDELKGLRKRMPGAGEKYEAAVAAGRLRHAEEMAAVQGRERARLAALADAQQNYDKVTARVVAEADAANAEIDAFRQAFELGQPEAVVNYFDLVLSASVYPDGFPQSYRLAYVPESKQLVIEYQLPDATVVPLVKAYKFVKTRDEITETSRPAAQIKALYGQIVAQVSLRTMHEVFEADRLSQVETLVFNGFVDTVDTVDTVDRTTDPSVPDHGAHDSRCLRRPRSRTRRAVRLPEAPRRLRVEESLGACAGATGARVRHG